MRAEGQKNSIVRRWGRRPPPVFPTAAARAPMAAARAPAALNFGVWFFDLLLGFLDLLPYLYEIGCCTAVARSTHGCGTIVSRLWHVRATSVRQHKSQGYFLISPCFFLISPRCFLISPCCWLISLPACGLGLRGLCVVAGGWMVMVRTRADRSGVGREGVKMMCQIMTKCKNEKCRKKLGKDLVKSK